MESGDRPPDDARDGSAAGGALLASQQRTSVRLLLRARRGDRAAISEIVARHVGPLTRWAHGRLPRWARTVADTGDLVQEALLQTLRRFHSFEPQGHAALQGYLRRAVDNRIKDEFRRIGRRGLASEVNDRFADAAPSPLQSAIVNDTERRYRDAVARLRETDRRLVVARVELGYSLEQLAAMTGRARPDTARVALRRALQRLAVEMARGS